MDGLTYDFARQDHIPDEVVEAAHSSARVSGLTHNFYRYPARFSPEFARAAIKHYTEPGDLVLDPFVGGGTSLVEAQAAGRDAIGFDISSLASFVSQVKTTPLTEAEIKAAQNWFASTLGKLRIDYQLGPQPDEAQSSYLRNLGCAGTWRHRKIIQIYLAMVEDLKNQRLSDFVRCVLLRTAQTQLDGRKVFKPIAKFRESLQTNFISMVDDIRSMRDQIEACGQSPTISIYQKSASDACPQDWKNKKSPRLVLTSPPYPGVHVLYHRWQVRGGRETPAPFWIANRLDGKGLSHYTLGDRKEAGLKSYFSKIETIFGAVAKVADRDTIFVQMIAFSQPDWQLPKYLEAMESAGLRELKGGPSKDDTARLWRDVPNRKWYAQFQPNQSSSREVVLFHKLAE